MEARPLLVIVTPVPTLVGAVSLVDVSVDVISEKTTRVWNSYQLTLVTP